MANVTSKMQPRSRRQALTLTAALLFAVIIASFWAAPVSAFFGHRGGVIACDFLTLYSAGHLVSAGDVTELYNPESMRSVQEAILHAADSKSPEVLRAAQDGASQASDRQSLSYLNPPFFALFLAPFSWFSFDTAFQLWTLLSVAAIGVSLLMMARIVSPLPFPTRAALLAGFFGFYPLTFSLILGQFSALLLLAWTGSFYYLRTGRPERAGVALAILLIKPELLILATLYVAWQRWWGVLRTLLPLSALAIATSFAIMGPGGALHYPLFLLQNARDPAHGSLVVAMFGWNAAVANLLGPAKPLLSSLLALPLVLVTVALPPWWSCACSVRWIDRRPCPLRSMRDRDRATRDSPRRPAMSIAHRGRRGGSDDEP